MKERADRFVFALIDLFSRFSGWLEWRLIDRRQRKLWWKCVCGSHGVKQCRFHNPRQPVTGPHAELRDWDGDKMQSGPAPLDAGVGVTRSRGSRQEVDREQ